MSKPNKQASKPHEKRRFVLRESQPDHLTPAERLAEHKASMAKRGPDANATVRLTMRGKMGGEKGAEAPLVRAMHDLANKPKRRSRRRKERS